MSKKITVTIEDDNERYFNQVAYELDNGDGKVVTHSQIINHFINELSLFEHMSGQSVSEYMEMNYKDDYQKYVNKK